MSPGPFPSRNNNKIVVFNNITRKTRHALAALLLETIIKRPLFVCTEKTAKKIEIILCYVGKMPI